MNSSFDSLLRARVCAAAQEHYRLLLEDGAECDAVPAGALRWSAELPAVGDWVRARLADSTLALIESVEPRTTCISRQRPGGGDQQVLAANVDLIIVVMGLDGDYNLRRLERYLVLAAASGAEVMVALNKMDACAEWEARLAEVSAIASNAVAMSAHRSVAPIAEAIRGRTAVLLGSSGAGKSTITNALLAGKGRGGLMPEKEPTLAASVRFAGEFLEARKGSAGTLNAGKDVDRALRFAGESLEQRGARQATQPVRESDSRGRHTTTHRMLVPMPGGGALIDTPGLRELALWAGQDSVDDVFAEIAALAERCRFQDCGHGDEPGCAVLAALEAGQLDPARWSSYQKLLAEARYHERTVDQRAAAAEKRKRKAIHKSMRHHPKLNR